MEQPLVQHAKSFHRVPVRHGGSGWRSVLGMPCSEPLERPRARRMALGRRAGAGCLQGDLTEQLEAQAGAVAAAREALGAMSRIELVAARRVHIPGWWEVRYYSDRVQSYLGLTRLY